MWSTDWFDNPEVQTHKLVAKLEQLKSGPPQWKTSPSLLETNRLP